MAFQGINFLQANTTGSPLMEELSKAIAQKHAEQRAEPMRQAALAKDQAQASLYGAQAGGLQAQSQQKAQELAQKQQILNQLFGGGQQASPGQAQGSLPGAQPGVLGGGVDADALKQAMIYKALGLGAPTRVNQAGDVPTTQTLSKHQGVVTSVDALIPMLDDLISEGHPGQLLGKYTSPSAQKTYESKVTRISEPMMKALGYPATDKGFQAAQDMVMAGKFETDADYKKRIQALKDDLVGRRGQSYSVIKGKKIPKESLIPQKSKSSDYSMTDLEHTAKLHNLTVEEVKRRLRGR